MSQQLPSLIARLATEPYFIPVATSAGLTDYQLGMILENTGQDPGRASGFIDERGMFKMWAKRNKVPDWLEPRLWREHQAKSGTA